MKDPASEHLRESLKLSDRLLDLAERGVKACRDDGCLVVYGIMRDCAYRIRQSVEKELHDHGTARPSRAGAAAQGCGRCATAARRPVSHAAGSPARKGAGLP